MSESFPFKVDAVIRSHNGEFKRSITIHRGLTVLIGPNGSGKTHILRGLKEALMTRAGGKKVRFLSAGRIGMLEQFRSDYDGHRGGAPRYDEAGFGGKGGIKTRHQAETLNGDIQTLSHRPDILIKIQERLRKLFRRDIIVEWDAGELKVIFARMEPGQKPYSSGREASGLLHLVGILSALYDDEVGALLIDEPEVSLHPQLQAFLLQEIVGVAGYPQSHSNKKLIVMATHSTEMIDIRRADDLSSFVFCYDLTRDPIQVDPNAGELKNKRVQGLISRLSQEHRLALFSVRPLLVEGPSDVIVCNAIARRLELHIEAAGSQLLPVIGKTEFTTVVKLFGLLGKVPVVLADADALADGTELGTYFLGGNTNADLRAAKLGASTAVDLLSGVYEDFVALVSAEWTAISKIAAQHAYWVNRGSDMVKAMRRAAFCSLFIFDDAIIAALSENQSWLKIKMRWNAVLDLLSDYGCFILRRGTIESYYKLPGQPTLEDKPSLAATEALAILQASKNDIESWFGDVVNCLRFASASESISEAESLRDLLLAVAAPAVARIQGATSASMEVLARTLIGERSKLFQLDVDKGELKIGINSTILDITGFPLTLKPGDDVVVKVKGSVAQAGV